MANPRRSTFVRVAYGCAAVAMLCALLVGGGSPHAVGLFPAPWDKLAHFAFFAGMTLVLVRALGPRALPVAVSLAIGVGAIDELHQWFLPGRIVGLGDFFADVAGVGFVWAYVRETR